MLSPADLEMARRIGADAPPLPPRVADQLRLVFAHALRAPADMTGGAERATA